MNAIAASAALVDVIILVGRSTEGAALIGADFFFLTRTTFLDMLGCLDVVFFISVVPFSSCLLAGSFDWKQGFN
jgi:hypothetical protein